MTDNEARARHAIGKTLAACTQAGDARRAEDYANCFTVDGVLDLDTPIEGRAAILAWMTAPSVIPRPAEAVAGFVSHHLTTCRIDLESPTTARVRTYWLVVTIRGLDHSGYYDDRFRAEDGAWLIACRRPRTLWKAPASLVASDDPAGG